MMSVQEWSKVVEPKLGSLTGTQALMCFSQLGDLVQAAENNESAEDAEAVRSLDGTLESLLLQLKQHTGPAAARGNRLDCTLLGAGLKTARQLQSPVKDRSAQKVLHNHSKTLRDIILEEGKLTTQDLLSGYHPEQGWKQPIQQKAVTTFQDLCQVPLLTIINRQWSNLPSTTNSPPSD